MSKDFWFRLIVIGYTLIAVFLVGTALYTLLVYGDTPQKEYKPVQTLNGGHIISLFYYPNQGRYYVEVSDGKRTETWEVSKGYFDRAILGAPINRRDNLNE